MCSRLVHGCVRVFWWWMCWCECVVVETVIVSKVKLPESCSCGGLKKNPSSSWINWPYAPFRCISHASGDKYKQKPGGSCTCSPLFFSSMLWTRIRRAKEREEVEEEQLEERKREREREEDEGDERRRVTVTWQRTRVETKRSWRSKNGNK